MHATRHGHYRGLPLPGEVSGPSRLRAGNVQEIARRTLISVMSMALGLDYPSSASHLWFLKLHAFDCVIEIDWAGGFITIMSVCRWGIQL